MALEVGSKAPLFSLPTKDESGIHPVSLADNFGKKNTVLLFFPGAFTGVCTTQFCSASGDLGDFSNLDAEVYGISGDTVFSLEAWAKQQNITVTLLADYQKEVIKAYDVVLEDLAGHGPASKRAAFVIDKEGVIRHVEVTPVPTEIPSVDAIMSALKSL